jgi:hypothetical protein
MACAAPAHAPVRTDERDIMNIDTKRLVADLAALALEARTLKTILHQTWTRPMADEQRRLARLRRRTTELCVLRACSRGRHHVQKPPREGSYPGMVWEREAWHARIAERVAKDYAIVQPSDGAGQTR